MSDHSKKHFLTGLKWVGAGKLVTQLITWSMTFFVLRLLSPSDYGVVALSTAITGLFALIAEFGFGAAITQAKDVDKEQLGNLFGFALLLNGAATLLAMAMAPLVAFIYAEPRLTAVIQAAACQFVIAALAILPDAQLRRAMRFREMAKTEFASGVAGGILTLGCTYFGLAYWSLVLGVLCTALVRVLLLHFLVREWIWPSFSLKPVRELVAFGGLTMTGRIVGHFLAQADILIAGIFFGREALGIYSVAMQLASLPLSRVMSIVNQVAFPVIARMRNDGTGSASQLLTGGKMITYLLFPALWGLAAVAPFVVTLFMGEHWQAAILPLQLVCLALPLRAISTLLTTAISAAGRADIDLRNTLTGAAVLPACFLIGIHFGVEGLASAWIVGIPFMVFFNVRRTAGPLGFSGKDILALLGGPAVTTVSMFLIVTLFSRAFAPNYSSVADFVATVAVGVLAYSAALALIDRKSLLAFAQMFSRRSIA
ncbi:MAG: lipopolysaccharide biosynthesis protein [Bacillota bacterium]